MTPTLTVSQFITVFNQSVQMMLPEVTIVGEVANFRISKNAWVYFDLKDEESSLKFFGSVKVLPGPLENGMNLEVNGAPWLHNLYGFSINIYKLKVKGEGSIAKAQALLAEKLKQEGLFNPDRKRSIPYPPARIGLITSLESAAYTDFIKVVNHRWGNLTIEIADCLVQGIDAPTQIIDAINAFNQMPNPPEVLVVIRGGGSADDLAAFSNEAVVRAVAASRIPTLVAIGHERDLSLAELAADRRASTPSNAAELLVPDKQNEGRFMKEAEKTLSKSLNNIFSMQAEYVKTNQSFLNQIIEAKLRQEKMLLEHKAHVLHAYDPALPLAKGYTLVRSASDKHVRSINDVKIKDMLTIFMADGEIKSIVEAVDEK